MSVAEAIDNDWAEQATDELELRLRKARSRYFWRSFWDILIPNPLGRIKAAGDYVREEFHPRLTETLLNRWDEMERIAEEGDPEKAERFLDRWEENCRRAMDIEQSGIRKLYNASLRGMLTASACHAAALTSLVAWLFL